MREIMPQQTGSAITGSASPHIAINPDPAVAARGRLFVMLPGTAAVPRTYQLIVQTGAPLGYHAIGLTYPNDEAVESLCGASADPDCAGDLRREIVTGENSSALANVDAANSIIGRLVALLRFLNTNFPNEGWGQFLVGDQPNWSLISVAGHSQGAGHAGFLAKLVSLERVAMFSGPGDTGVQPGSSALWLSLPNVTPASRQYGFTHVSDPLITLSTATNNWRTIGLDAFGSVQTVDGMLPPFANSRQLQTAAPPNPNPTGISLSPFHGAPVVDAVTPRDAAGQPLFRPVWIYMAFP